MMGTKERSFAPLIHTSLEELVPADHFYRHLERTLDLSFVREFVQETYTNKGRPSIDPVVFFKLQLVMFFEDIRSERLLMRQVADRLSVRWYLGYDLDDPLPDHSSLSRIRTRYGLDLFRRFFDAILEQCQQAKLIWGKELYIDATKVDANASVDSLTTRFAVEAREAFQKHLQELFQEEVDQHTPEPDPSPLEAAPQPLPLPNTQPEEERETLLAQQASRHDWYAKGGEQQREVRGLYQYYQRRADQRISTTDPDATPMRHGGGPVHLGYQTHYVVDGGKQRMILAALVTPAEVMENQPALDLLWHVRFRWRLRPRQVTGDTKYGTLENIKAIEDAGMRAYIPLFNRENEHGAYYGSSRFTYDAVHDRYICPNGQPLYLTRMEYKAEKAEYQADAAACNACPLKAECTPSPYGRQVHRSFHADYLERVKGYYQTEAYQKALRKRKVWVEPLFGEAKEWHGMRRFRLRRLWKVNCEALVIAGGQNLKRLLKKRGWGRRPFPTEALSASFWLLFGRDVHLFLQQKRFFLWHSFLNGWEVLHSFPFMMSLARTFSTGCQRL
ncbi:MAG: IS1182 family transposase [Chloroflexota bacterium]|nr:IS1182 family transposase [Chloroflexota bacterium]